MIKLVECPRDAMQGIKRFIPTELKAAYLNSLLRVGFHTLDFGSFVSEKAIPQLSDTSKVFSKLELDGKTRLLAIAANIRGVEAACAFKEINYVGFPFSISETFQLRNTNSTISKSLDTVKGMIEICSRHEKAAVIYLSMGFGNPYGDDWNEDILAQRTEELVTAGARILALSDTIGTSTPEQIKQIFPGLKQSFPSIEWGLHLHSSPENSKRKLEAALEAGCERIDSAIKGYGGCPMAADDLTGNIATENVLQSLIDKGIDPMINITAFEEAMKFSDNIFLKYH